MNFYNFYIGELMGGCLSKQSTKNIRFIDERQQLRFEQGKPIFVEAGLKVIKNPTTNKLQGIPEEWITNLNLPLQIDYGRVVNTQAMREQLRPDEQLPEAIIQLINQPQQEKSKVLKSQWKLRASTFMKNQSKVKLDSSQPFGLIISNNWSDTLTTSFDNPKQINDPQKFVDLMSKVQEGLKESVIEKQLLSTSQFLKKMSNIKFIEDHPSQNFIFRQQLGHGGVCKVFKAEARYSPQTFYAVRIMKQKDEETLHKIRSQIAVMELCTSPNIVEYHFTYYYRESLFMFIQYMDSGCLTNFVKKYNKKIPQNIIAFILKGILKGLIAIHSRKQIHRDLKSDNILLDKKGHIKIADFGYALQLTTDKLSTIGIAGTPAWMAPQLIMKEQYNQMADIWSLGIIVLELCHGQPPYLRMQPLKAMYRIASEKPPVLKGFSGELCDFVGCCLKKDPNQRYSAIDLISHPFIKSIGMGLKESEDYKFMIKGLQK